MKINSTLLSIPPYISTSWKNVAALHLEIIRSTPYLVVTLNEGTQIEIPGLDQTAVEQVFKMHAQHIEQEETPTPETFASAANLPEMLSNLTGAGVEGTVSIAVPLKFPFPEIQSASSLLQHNPDQENMPELPRMLLDKIISLTKIMGINDSQILPEMEKDCNCLHCQVVRAMHSSIDEAPPKIDIDEPVSDADLVFRTWDIAQTGDQLYIVTNPLDQQEQYSVYLGEPLGCTCGQKHCDHIKAVLSN